MERSILLRFFSALLVVVAIAAIGYLAFNAGFAQGAAANVGSFQGQAGGSAVPAYGWHPWFLGFPFYGFGLFGALFGLFLFFMALRLITFAIWGPRWGYGRHMHGVWRHGWMDENGLPPMFREWHDRAHRPEDSDSKA